MGVEDDGEEEEEVNGGEEDAVMMRERVRATERSRPRKWMSLSSVWARKVIRTVPDHWM